MAIVSLDRPPNNFADEALLKCLGEAFAAADADPIVRVILLRAEGRVFCAGAPLAVQATRATLRGDLAALVEAATDHELAEQSWLQQTADFSEGVRAVNERRPGQFVGA